MPDTTAEEITQRPEVKEELERASGDQVTTRVTAQTRDKLWFLTHALVLAGCAALYFLINTGFIPLKPAHSALAYRTLRGIALIVVLLAAAKLIIVYSIGRLTDVPTRHTLKRIVRLLAAFAIFLVAISIIFVNWYAALTALGVGSVIVGLAVQTPMTSFIGWIYLLARHPYRVGDRIKIGDATGDVIDVSYLDTTLWEFGGQYFSGDHPSGRNY